jgi:hypothetical protein
MTGAEWLACTEPVSMLKASRSRFKHRKLRLFAVACCRSIWKMLPDQRSRCAIEVAEKFADERATGDQLRIAGADAEAAHNDAFKTYGKVQSCIEWAAVYVAAPMAFRAAKNVSWMSSKPRMNGEVLVRVEYLAQAGFVRDIFGNPFRPVSINPAWLTWNNAAVPKLAQSIYDDRAFDRLPLLADALVAAGCTNEDILAHCRSGGEHVRGCWVVDLVLWKE